MFRLGFLAAVMGCSAPISSGNPTLTLDVHSLPVAPADYASVAWVDADTLVLDWMPPPLPDGRSQGTRLVALNLDSFQHRALPHAVSDASCDFIEEFAPKRMVDGRVAFLRECVIYGGPDTPVEIAAMAVDTGEEEQLAALGDPWTPDERALINSFTLRPGRTEGFVGFGAAICDGVARFDARGVTAFDFALPEPAGDNLANMFTGDCVATVNARNPAWSPDGAVIAVLIAPGVAGRNDFDRLDADYELDLLDPSTGAIRRIAKDLREARTLAWSPDGETIAVIMDAGLEDRTETWLIETQSGARRQLLLRGGEKLGDVSWSPDGRRLAGLAFSTDAKLDPFLVQPVIMDWPADVFTIGSK